MKCLTAVFGSVKRCLVVIIGIIWLNPNAFGQKITNIKLLPDSSKIEITYDLSGKKDRYDIDLLYSTKKGLLWHGPSKKVSGDIKGQMPGLGKKMVVDINDFLKFKLQAKPSPLSEIPFDKSKLPPGYFKYDRWKKIWLYSGIGAGTVGIISSLAAQFKYTDYQTATTKAMKLHQEIKRLDQISTIAFGVTGICALEYIYLNQKEKRIRRNALNLSALPYHGGMGIELAYTF